MNLRANFNEIITRTSTNKESRQDKCRVKRKRRRGAIVGEAMTVSTDADAENESKDESSKLKMNRERAMTMTRSQRQLRPVAHHFHFPHSGVVTARQPVRSKQYTTAVATPRPLTVGRRAL